VSEAEPTDPPTSASASFQQRILEMLEGAAQALLADHIRERERAAQTAVLDELARQVELLGTSRQELVAAQQSFLERVQEVDNLELRARRRVRKTATIVQRYKALLEELYERIEDL
jgi:hypothetical protein